MIINRFFASLAVWKFKSHTECFIFHHVGLSEELQKDKNL